MSFIQIGGTVIQGTATETQDAMWLNWLGGISQLREEGNRGREQLMRLQNDLRRVREEADWLEGTKWYDVDRSNSVNHGE